MDHKCWYNYSGCRTRLEFSSRPTAIAFAFALLVNQNFAHFLIATFLLKRISQQVDGAPNGETTCLFGLRVIKSSVQLSTRTNVHWACWDTLVSHLWSTWVGVDQVSWAVGAPSGAQCPSVSFFFLEIVAIININFVIEIFSKSFFFRMLIRIFSPRGKKYQGIENTKDSTFIFVVC